jgi:hypothetical protein
LKNVPRLQAPHKEAHPGPVRFLAGQMKEFTRFLRGQV